MSIAIPAAPHSPAPAMHMHADDFSLAVPRDERLVLAHAWLMLALASLVGAGLLSVLLVLSRTPYVQQWLPVADFFHVALVAHVDLSVLVWFLSMGGMLWSLNGSTRFLSLAWGAWIMAAAGTTVMTIAPLIGTGGPIMSNYVPVLEDKFFMTGLIVFGIGVTMLVLRALLTAPKVGMRPTASSALAFGVNTAAVATAVALGALAWSWLTVPTALDGKTYYELLFWGSGHVIQFTYTLLMLVGWLWLAGACGGRPPLSPRITLMLFAIGLASVFLVPPIYLAYNVMSSEHRLLLTWLMRFGGGLPILPMALAVAISLWAIGRPSRLTPAQRPLHAALVTSLALFCLGGVIGFLIQGSNVKIPAHYHGCIVGVTLALMGLAYHLLPRLGFRQPDSRLAHWQPYIYAGGQLMHIVGLVWSGGYGVQRKVAGSSQVLRSTQEVIGMGVMGLGGLIAVIGGMLFLIVVFRAMSSNRSKKAHVRAA